MLQLKSLPRLMAVLASVAAIIIWLTGWPGAVGAQEPTEGDVSIQAALGTTFRFQGRLTDGGSPANGSYDFEFKLYDAATGGSQVGGTVTKEDMVLTDGFYGVGLDFGANVFTRDKRFLEVGVRPGSSSGAYTLQSPRLRLDPVPHALAVRLPLAESVASSSFAFQITNSNGPSMYGSSSSHDGVTGSSNGGGRSGVYGYSNNANGYGGFFRNQSGGIALGLEGNGSTREKAALLVHNPQTDRGMAVYFTNNSNFATAHFANAGTVGQVLYLQSNGGYFIEAVNNAESETRFSVDYSGKTTTRVLQITGGADLSEQFDIRNHKADLPPLPGQVVCIDAKHPGELVICEQAYDYTVAGIISGAGGVKPGMVRRQSGSTADGKYPVALTGRVYVWADASSGPIRPGDLLTTSDTPGHAMKVADYERAQGAIFGKAMSGLEEGQGLVLVLVSLQ